MINIRTLKKITDNGGLTLKNGRPIVYKSGWQVATEGKETSDIKEAMRFIKAYGGNCGIWFANGIWYIDLSKRVNTKKEALEIGRRCNQISILRWRDMGLAYCQTLFFMWKAGFRAQLIESQPRIPFRYTPGFFTWTFVHFA